MKQYFAFVLSLMLVIGCGSNETTQETTSQKISPHQTSSDVLAEIDRHIEAGVQHLGAGDVPAAINSFDNAIRQDPQQIKGYLVLGETYLRLKSYDRAIGTLLAAEGIDAENGRVQYLLAVAFGLQNQPEFAIKRAQKSVELFQDNRDHENFLKSLALLQSLSQVDAVK